MYARLAFKLLSILFDYPSAEFRQVAESWGEIEALLSGWCRGFAQLVRSFLENVGDPEDAYVSVFEAPPKCPPYAHGYIFREGDGEVGKFLLEIKVWYKSAGLDIANRELPDYLPAMLEYVAHTGDFNFLARYVAPWIGKFRACLEREGSPYARLAEALEKAIECVSIVE